MRYRVARYLGIQNPKNSWFRMTVPERFRARLGRHEGKMSPETDNQTEARVRHPRKLAEKHDLMAWLDATIAIKVDDLAAKFIAEGFEVLAQANIAHHADCSAT